MSDEKGAIHDQGYQRYTGERRKQAQRFLVIARNVVKGAWKQKWAVQVPIFGTVISVIVAAGVMVALTNLGRQFTGARGMLQPAADGILGASMEFFEIPGFLLAVAVAAGAVADDLSAGAFQFYFSRPLRAADYVRGKLLGLFAVVGVATLAGPFVLALVRVGLAIDDPDFAYKALILPKVTLVGIAMTAALVLPAAALGALLGKKTPARVAFALLWTVYSHFIWGVSQVFDEPRVRLLSPNSCADTIAGYLLDTRGTVGQLPHPAEATAVLVLMIGGLYFYIRRRVRTAESAGLGAV